MISIYLDTYGVDSEVEGNKLVFPDFKNYMKVYNLFKLNLLEKSAVTIPVQEGIIQHLILEPSETEKFTILIHSSQFLSLSLQGTKSFPTLQEAEDYFEDSSENHKLEVL